MFRYTVSVSLRCRSIARINNCQRRCYATSMYTMQEALQTPLEGDHLVIEREDGTRLSTTSLGTGPKDIVLAHGYGVNKHCWNIISHMLDYKQYRLIAFDQRGHGDSSIGSEGISSSTMASDYKAVLETYDVKNGVLGGHSLGGFLAQKFILSFPEVVTKRLKGCLLMGTFAGDINRDNFQNRLQIPLIKAGILVPILKNKVVARLFSKSLAGKDFNESIGDAMLEAFSATDHKELVPILEAACDENYYDEIHKIDLPCTIIVGTMDNTTPAFHTDEMHANIPNSNVVKIPDTGHMINWEAPQAILDELEKLAA